VPLEPNVQLRLALASMATLGVLALSEVYRFRKAKVDPTSG